MFRRKPPTDDRFNGMIALSPDDWLEAPAAVRHLRDKGHTGDLHELLRSKAASGDVAAVSCSITIDRCADIDPSFWQTSLHRAFDWDASTFRADVADPPETSDGPWRVTHSNVLFKFVGARSYTDEPEKAGPDTIEAPVSQTDQGTEVEPTKATPGHPRDTLRWELVEAIIVRLAIDGRLTASSPDFVGTKANLVNTIRRSSMWKGKAPPFHEKTLRPYVDRLCERTQLELTN